MSDLKEYIIERDVINPRYIKNLFTTFFQVSNLFTNDELLQQSKPYDWSDLKFNLSLINLRKNEPEKFSAIYDNFQNGLYVYNFLYKNKLDKIVYKFLNANESEVTLYNAYLRMDPPVDNRNSLDWHVDVSKNKFVKNACTIWCPLTDVNENNGTIKILPGSSNENFVNKDIKFQKKFLNKYTEMNIPLLKNDILIFNYKLVHRSGFNQSKKIRFVLVFHFEKLDNYKTT